MSVIEYDLIPNNGVLLNIGSSFADYGNFPSFLFVCCRIQMEKLFNMNNFSVLFQRPENGKFVLRHKNIVPTIYQITFITSFFLFCVVCLFIHLSCITSPLIIHWQNLINYLQNVFLLLLFLLCTIHYRIYIINIFIFFWFIRLEVNS